MFVVKQFIEFHSQSASCLSEALYCIVYTNVSNKDSTIVTVQSYRELICHLYARGFSKFAFSAFVFERRLLSDDEDIKWDKLVSVQ